MSKTRKKSVDAKVEQNTVEASPSPVVPESEIQNNAEEGKIATDEEKAKFRKQLIEDYNKNNEYGIVILDKVATKEDADDVETIFNTMSKKIMAFTCSISDSANSLRVANFLKDWNKTTVCWNGGYWRGVIKFDEFISGWLERNENSETPEELILDVGALTYLYSVMSNPAGFGIESAIKMQAMEKEYSSILELVDNFYKDLNTQYSKLKVLDEIYGLRCQGYFATFKDASIVEPTPTEEK